MQKTKRTAETNLLRAEIDDLTVRAESRSLNLTWTTGHKGLRSSYDGPFYEELSLDPSAVDLTHLAAGAPLLNSHNSNDLSAVIGVVEKVWLEGNKGRATVRFSDDQESEKIFQKVKAGIIKSVSVGYSVSEYTDTSKPGDEIPTLLATKWVPRELSAVSIPFDPGAQFYRNQEINKSNDFNHEVPILQEKKEMNIKDNAERTRQNEIRTAVRAANLGESYSDELCNSDVSADEARKQIIAKLADFKAATSIDNTVKVEVGESTQGKTRGALVEAIATRLDNSYKPNNTARIFQGRSMIHCLETYMGGRLLSETDMSLAKRAMTTSDLANVLANSAEKSIANRFNNLELSYSKFIKPATVRNFKSHARVKSSEFGALAQKNEGGEYVSGYIEDSAETVQLKHWGLITSFSHEMLANDDLNVLSNMVSQAGFSAKKLENKRVYTALQNNKTMSDSVALYHASHGNLGSAAALSIASLGEAVKLMRKQTGINGVDYLNLQPKYLVVSPDIEVAARQILASVQASQISNVNIFAGSLELIVDAEMTSATAWYVLADPSAVDTVSLFRLEGEETPQVSSRYKFETGDFQLKVTHNCEASVLDHRGIVKNAGA